MPATPLPPLPSAQAQAEKMIDAWVARNLDTEDGVERRRRAADAARRLVQLALSLEPAVADTPGGRPPADVSGIAP